MAFIHIKEPGIPQQFITVILCFQIFVQIIAELVRISQPEFPDSFFTQPSAREIGMCLCSAFPAKLIVKIARSLFVDLEKSCPSLYFCFRLSGILDLRKLHPCPVSQVLQRLTERVILVFHHKVKYISPCPAAEAIIHLLGGSDRKGRSLFIMKRTKTKIGTSPPGQFYILGYNIYNIISHSYFFNDIV